MREIAESEVPRNFSAVLDEAEHGETIVVTRNGRRVALIVPAPRANGDALRAVFQDWSNRAGLDEGLQRSGRRGAGHGIKRTRQRSVARLILDTGVLLHGARGQLDATAIGDQDDVAVPTVVIAEYLTGVLLDATRVAGLPARIF